MFILDRPGFAATLAEELHSRQAEVVRTPRDLGVKEFD